MTPQQRANNSVHIIDAAWHNLGDGLLEYHRLSLLLSILKDVDRKGYVEETYVILDVALVASPKGLKL